MPSKNKANELHLERVYDAPLKVVWDAWNDPKKAAKWWGPRGFTITTHSKDLRPGGNWTYTMHGPDGTDYRNVTFYHEVVKYQKLVYDHGGSEDRPPLFRVTVLFSEVKGQTKIDLTMALPTPEAAQEAKKFIKKAGGEATWDRLAEYLESESSGEQIFVINRAFEAPIDKVFAMWTKAGHFAQWLPPIGFKMEFKRCSIEPGGHAVYKMFNNEWVVLHGRIEYLEIEKPTRIVYTQQFCDENENLSRHPMIPTWPATILTAVTFAEESPDRTRITVRWSAHGRATAEELRAFIDMRGSMTQGWTGSFDKLEDLLQS